MASQSNLIQPTKWTSEVFFSLPLGDLLMMGGGE
jgi:hypothetical protein